MSLLSESMQTFTIMNRNIVDDGLGGVETVWTPGATINGAMVVDTSTQSTMALAMGATAIYTFTVSKTVELDYHTVLRRTSDGKVFRLTTNTDDKKTPAGAGLDMRQYRAEEWVLND